MNFMSANLPYPTASLVDVLSILELVGDHAKSKKIIKELQLASIEFSDAKHSHEIKSSELDKKESEINKKIEKSLSLIVKSEESKKELQDKMEEFKALDLEYKQKEEALKQFETRNSVEKSEYDNILAKGQKEINVKTLELNKAQAECDKLIQEYSEKLAKLKAVME